MSGRLLRRHWNDPMSVSCDVSYAIGRVIVGIGGRVSVVQFKQVNFSLSTLVDQIDMGTIGLPDIQRPFVWKTVKVRDLFDSMFRGYPVGYLLFWENAFEPGAK